MSEIINVLWVENEVDLFDPYKDEAADYGLILNPFSCWEKAKSILINHYDDFSAIILDAKCVLRDGEDDDAMEFLPVVIRELSLLALERKRTIPWFVLSAGGGDVGRIPNWVKNGRLEWDDWEKVFYSKAVDRPALFTRIPKIAVQSEATQIKTILYRDVFEALGSFKGMEVVSAKSILVKILTALHFNSDGFDPILHYNQLRQLLEYLFRACNNVGLVPDECIENGQVNLHQSYMYVAGKEAKYAGVVFNGEAGEKIATPHIASEMSSILYLGNNKSHTAELDENDQLIMEEFFRTNNSKYIIFSLALQMCDVIVWLKDYISKHSVKAENLSKCKQIAKDEKAIYEGNEFTPEKDENNCWHCEECLVIIRSVQGVKKIRLRDVADNTDPRTKHQYKYFAYYDVV